MLTMILNWVLSALVLLAVTQLLPGVHVDSFGTALIAIAVISLVNGLVAPIVTLLTLPVNVLTLGLFSFVITAAMFGLAAYLVPGFTVDGFGSALLGALLLGLLTSVLHMVLPKAAV